MGAMGDAALPLDISQLSSTRDRIIHYAEI
jgi:hypothetical protein